MASTGETITADRPQKQVRTRIEYRRFNVFHRWMHFLVFVSFTVLVLTGMPLKYKDSEWAQWVMDATGGVTAAGVYHRIAAVITMVYWTAEVLYMIVSILRRRVMNQSPKVRRVTGSSFLMALTTRFFSGSIFPSSPKAILSAVAISSAPKR